MASRKWHIESHYPSQAKVRLERGTRHLLHVRQKPPLVVYEATLEGDGDGVGAVIRAEFGKNALHVAFDGSF